MSDFHVVYVFQNKDGSRLYDIECVVPNLPQIGDLTGLQGVKDKPFKSCLGRVQNVVRIIYPAEATVFQNRALIVSEVLYTSTGDVITVEAISR